MENTWLAEPEPNKPLLDVEPSGSSFNKLITLLEKTEFPKLQTVMTLIQFYEMNNKQVRLLQARKHRLQKIFYDPTDRFIFYYHGEHSHRKFTGFCFFDELHMRYKFKSKHPEKTVLKLLSRYVYNNSKFDLIPFT